VLLRVGANVFVNHECTLNDMGGIEIGENAMIGPNVSPAGHISSRAYPHEPSTGVAATAEFLSATEPVPQ